MDGGEPAGADVEAALVLVALQPGGHLGRHPVPAHLPVAVVEVEEPAPLGERQPPPQALGGGAEAVDDGAPAHALPGGGLDLAEEQLGERVGGDLALRRAG